MDLVGYLFGDIPAVSAGDLWWVWGGGVLVLAALAAIWRPLLASTVHEELAQVEGVPVAFVRLAFMLLIALVIAISMKIVGVLLITSMMIIPAAAARRFSRTPEQMALVAALNGYWLSAWGWPLLVLGYFRQDLRWLFQQPCFQFFPNAIHAGLTRICQQ